MGVAVRSWMSQPHHRKHMPPLLGNNFSHVSPRLGGFEERVLQVDDNTFYSITLLAESLEDNRAIGRRPRISYLWCFDLISVKLYHKKQTAHRRRCSTRPRLNGTTETWLWTSFPSLPASRTCSMPAKYQQRRNHSMSLASASRTLTL